MGRCPRTILGLTVMFIAGVIEIARGCVWRLMEPFIAQSMAKVIGMSLTLSKKEEITVGLKLKELVMAQVKMIFVMSSMLESLLDLGLPVSPLTE